MKPIPVACALIFRKAKVLAAKRSHDMSQGGFWEFAGGKLESGESPQNCLKREIMEELNIQISVLMEMNPHEFSYSIHKTILLMPFLCRWKSGDIWLAEHEQVRWLEYHELQDLNWAPADRPIVEELVRYWIPIQKILEKDTKTHPYVC